MSSELPDILAFPPEKRVSRKEWDKQAREYVAHISRLQQATWTRPIDRQNILDLLNPSRSSLAYLLALNAQCANAGKDRSRTEDCITRSTIFFTSFDPIQMRYAGGHWLALITWAFDVYPAFGIRDFRPLCAAILRLDPTAGTFTSAHLLYLRMCLECSVPSQALPILDKDIYAFPTAPNKVTSEELLCSPQELSHTFINTQTGLTHLLKPEYILEYYLTGALVYIGLRNYNRARLFLEYLILTPTSHHAASTLQIEAYKKWVLLGLLAQGKLYPLPRTHDQQVLKILRAASKPYDELAQDFAKRDWRKFQAECEVGTAIWNEDGNTRLVLEVSDALMRYRILDLQAIYSTLPISRVAKHLSLAETATLNILTTMVQQSHLSATITTDNILHFLSSDTSTPTDSDMDIPLQTARINTLITSLRSADRRLQLTKEYTDVQKRQKKGAGGPGGPGAGPDADLADSMDLSWDGPPIAGMDNGGFANGDDGEEDIMAL